MSVVYHNSPLPYYFGLVLPISAWIGLELGAYWTILATAVAFVILPLADTLRGVDNESPSSSEIIELESRWSYRIVLYVNVAVQTALLARACVVWSSGTQSFYELAFEVLGLVS